MSNLSASSTNANIYNVCSLEHCYTNLFALTDLTGIKWLRLRAKDVADSAGGGEGGASRKSKKKKKKKRGGSDSDEDEDEDDDDDDDDDDEDSSDGDDDSSADSMDSAEQRGGGGVGVGQSTPSKANANGLIAGGPVVSSSLLTSSVNDPVLATHAKCLKEDILSSWKRVTVPPVAKATNINSKMSPLQQSQPQFHKELWIFWYEKEEPANLKHIISTDLVVEENSNQATTTNSSSQQQQRQHGGGADSGQQSITAAASSSTNGLPYECRSMLFKALHNLIEKCLIEKGYARLGKWFVMPYNHIVAAAPFGLGANQAAFINGEFTYAHQAPTASGSSGAKALADENHHVSYSFSFFLHGASRVCTSVDIKLHRPIRTLNVNDLARLKRLVATASQRLDDEDESNCGGAVSQQQRPVPGINVILAPYGVAGRLVGYVHNESAESRQTCNEWRQFYPLKLIASLPHVFIVLVENQRYKLFYPNSFVYVVIDEAVTESSESSSSDDSACDSELDTGGRGGDQRDGDQAATTRRRSGSRSRSSTKGGGGGQTKESDSKEMDSLDLTIFLVARDFGNEDDEDEGAPATAATTTSKSSVVQSPSSPSVISNSKHHNSPKIPASPLTTSAAEPLMSPNSARRRPSLSSPFKSAATGSTPVVPGGGQQLKRNKSSNFQQSSPGSHHHLKGTLSLNTQPSSGSGGGDTMSSPNGTRKKSLTQQRKSSGPAISNPSSRTVLRLRRQRAKERNRRIRMRHVLLNIRKRMRNSSSATHSLSTIIDLIQSPSASAAKHHGGASGYRSRSSRRMDRNRSRFSFTSAEFLKSLARNNERHGDALNACCRRFDYTMDNQIRLKHKQIELMHENAPLAFDVLDKCQLGGACIACTCGSSTAAKSWCAKCTVSGRGASLSQPLTAAAAVVCQCSAVIKQSTGLEPLSSAILNSRPALQALPQLPQQPLAPQAKIKSEPLIPQLTSFNTVAAPPSVNTSTAETATATVATATTTTVTIKNLNSLVQLQPFHHRQCYFDHDQLDDRSAATTANSEHPRVKLKKSIKLIKNSPTSGAGEFSANKMLLAPPGAATVNKSQEPPVVKKRLLKIRTDNTFLSEGEAGEESEKSLSDQEDGNGGYGDLDDDLDGSLDWSGSLNTTSSSSTAVALTTNTDAVAASENAEALAIQRNLNTVSLAKTKPSSLQFFEHDDDDSLFEEGSNDDDGSATSLSPGTDPKKLKKQMRRSLLNGSSSSSSDDDGDDDDESSDCNSKTTSSGSSSSDGGSSDENELPSGSDRDGSDAASCASSTDLQKRRRISKTASATVPNGVMNGGNSDVDADEDDDGDESDEFFKAVKLVDKKVSKRAAKKRGASAGVSSKPPETTSKYSKPPAHTGLSKAGVTSFYDDLYKQFYEKDGGGDKHQSRRPCLTNLTNKTTKLVASTSYKTADNTVEPAVTMATGGNNDDDEESGHVFSSLYNTDYKQQILSLITASSDTDLYSNTASKTAAAAIQVAEDPYEFRIDDGHAGSQQPIVSNATMANSISLAKSQMTPPKSVESVQPSGAASSSTAAATGFFSSTSNVSVPPISYDDLNNIFEEESSSLSADDQQHGGSQAQQQQQQPANRDEHGSGQAGGNGSAAPNSSTSSGTLGGGNNGSSQFKPNGVPTPTCISVVMTPPSHESIAHLYNQVASVGAPGGKFGAGGDLATSVNGDVEELTTVNGGRWTSDVDLEKDPDYLQTRLTKLNDYSTLLNSQKRSSFNDMLENTFELFPVLNHPVAVVAKKQMASQAGQGGLVLSNKYKPVNMVKLDKVLATISATEIDYEYEMELLKEEFAGGAKQHPVVSKDSSTAASLKRARQKMTVNFLKERIANAKSRLRWTLSVNQKASTKRGRRGGAAKKKTPMPANRSYQVMLPDHNTSSSRSSKLQDQQTCLTCSSSGAGGSAYINVSLVKKQPNMAVAKTTATGQAAALTKDQSAQKSGAGVEWPASVKSKAGGPMNGPMSVGGPGVGGAGGNSSSPSLMPMSMARANSNYPPAPKTPLSQQQVASPYYGGGAGQFTGHHAGGGVSSNVPTPVASQGGPNSVGGPMSNHPAYSGVGSVGPVGGGGGGNLSMEQSFGAVDSPSLQRGGPMSNKPPVVKSQKSLPAPASTGPTTATAVAVTAANNNNTSLKKKREIEAKKLELQQRSQYLLSSAAVSTTDMVKSQLALNGLCLNMNLSDTLLNAFRDINFDSCTLCVCSNNNIHGIDYSIYICNDIFDMDEAAKLTAFAPPFSATSSASAATQQQLNSSASNAAALMPAAASGNQHNQCTCGFSSIVNRQLFASTATIVRMSDLVAVLARQAGVDPQVLLNVLTSNTGGGSGPTNVTNAAAVLAKTPSKPNISSKPSAATVAAGSASSQASLIELKTRLFKLFNLNTNTFNRNYLVLLNTNNCNGVFFEDYVDALSVIQPAVLSMNTSLFPSKQQQQQYEYYLNACLLVRDNYLLKPNIQSAGLRWRQLMNLGSGSSAAVSMATDSGGSAKKQQQPPKRQASLLRCDTVETGEPVAATTAPSNSVLDLLDVRSSCPFLSVQESFDLFYSTSRRTGDCNTAGFNDLDLEYQIKTDERDIFKNVDYSAASDVVSASKRKRTRHRGRDRVGIRQIEKYKLNVLDENNVCSNVIKRLANVTKTKASAVTSTTTTPAQSGTVEVVEPKQASACTNPPPAEVLHRWLWSKKEIKSNLELSKSLKLIQPLLEETVQKKYTTSRMWESFQGPLTWQHFCRLAFRDSDSRSGPSHASGSHHAGHSGAGSSVSSDGGHQNSYEPEPIPALLVSSSDRDWLAVSPYAIKFWDKLNLEPYCKQKNVAYIVLYPDFGSDDPLHPSSNNIKQEHENSGGGNDANDAAGLGNAGDQLPTILQNVKEYLRELTSMYELCRLGIHRPALRIAPDHGFVRVPFTSVNSAAASKPPLKPAGNTGNVTVDSWFSEIEANSATERLGANLKSLAVTLKSLAVKISNGYLGPNASILTHLATYNPTSAASTLTNPSSSSTTTTTASFSTPHVQSTIPLISLDRTLFEEIRTRFDDTPASSASNTTTAVITDLNDHHHHHHHNPHHISSIADHQQQQHQQQAQILNIGGSSASSSSSSLSNHHHHNDLDQHQQQQQQRAANQSAIAQLTANMSTSPALIVYIVDPFDYYLYALKNKKKERRSTGAAPPDTATTATAGATTGGEQMDTDKSGGAGGEENTAAAPNDENTAGKDEDHDSAGTYNTTTLTEEDLKRLRHLGIYKAYLEFYQQLPDIFKYSTQFQIVPLNMIADIQQQSTSMYLQALMQNQTCGSNYSSCFGSGMGTGWSDLDMDYKLSLFKAQAFNIFALSKRHFMTPAHNFYLNIQQQHNSMFMQQQHLRAKSLTGMGPAATEERFLRDNLLSFGLPGGASTVGGQLALPAASKNWTFAQVKKITFYSPPFILAPSTLSSSAIAAMAASNLFFKNSSSANGTDTAAANSNNKLAPQTSSSTSTESSSLLSNFIHLNLSNSNYGFLNPGPPGPNNGTSSNAAAASSASSAVDQQQQCNVLYVSYCLSEDQRYLLTCCCDENGELVESTSIHIEVDERMRRREAHARRLALRKLWEFIIVIISQTCKPWRLVIGRLGRMGHSELRGWGCLISKKNLQRVCAQIKESCDTCQTLGQMEMPCILSACLISMETCDNICIYPEAYSREDKSAAAALNGQQLLPNHAAQAHGISCTHILTFPASAVIQTHSANMMMINKDNDPMSKSGAMPMDDDFLNLFNFDKLEDDDIGDLLNGDGHNKPCFNESGMAMECETNVNAREKIESLLNQEEMPHLDQQPLAVGYYVSTARCGVPLPSWLLGNGVSSLDTNSHTFKATLHIHNRYALEDDELSVQGKTEYSHKLDSSVTYEVLRYVLEKYNALSWLNVDPVMQDRKSCLPINHVLLLQMYYAFKNYV